MDSMDEDEECCLSDALLADVAKLARKRRADIRSAYTDPEEAWLDGFLAGWFDGHFSTPSQPVTNSIHATEGEEICPGFDAGMDPVKMA